MATIPVKVLKDKNQEAFVPFTVTDAVFVPDSDQNISDFLEAQIERINEAIANLEDYDRLDNKPQINNVELTGNVSLDDLGVQPEGDYPEDALTNNDIDNLINQFAE